MASTLANINSTINDRRRDTGSTAIDMTGDGFRAVNSTLQVWNQSHDWEFQIEETILNYNEGITYYAVPTAFKAAIDMRYYKGLRRSEFDMVSETMFDSDTLTRRRFAISTTGQTERLRIKGTGNTLQIDPSSELTSNGTWVGATAISNVATDSYEFFDLNSSVSFDYSGTTGTITKTLTTGVDLTEYQNRSSIYWNVYFPSVTNWTSMTLKIGTDASNYYTASVTTDYLGQSLTANQWAKFKIAWSSFTTVGSPTITNIAYIQLTIAFSIDPAATGFRIEDLFISENIPIVFEYYSTNMVQAASGGAKTQIFSNSSNTTDTPLWTGKWDFITESFINSVLETIFWMTGEYDDMALATKKIETIVNNLKQRIPSRRRYPEMAIKFDIN